MRAGCVKTSWPTMGERLLGRTQIAAGERSMASGRLFLSADMKKAPPNEMTGL